MPQYPPGNELVGAIERLRGYAAAAGRDPSALGIECGVRVKRNDDPTQWVADAHAYQQLGATHLRISTMGGGFTDPADHLAAWLRWHHVVAPELKEIP